MMEPSAARASQAAGTVYLGAPAFTRLLWALMPYWFVPPMFAAIYCGIIWTRKNSKASWFAFFSFTTATLFILLLPVLIASQLPIINFLHTIPVKTFEATH